MSYSGLLTKCPKASIISSFQHSSHGGGGGGGITLDVCPHARPRSGFWELSSFLKTGFRLWEQMARSEGASKVLTLTLDPNPSLGIISPSSSEHNVGTPDLARQFSILKKCQGNLYCLISEMLFIRDHRSCTQNLCSLCK